MKYLIILLMTACNWQTEDLSHKEGDIEYFNRFVLIPVSCLNNKTYWFTTIKMMRIYDVHCGWNTCEIYPREVCAEK